MNLLNGEVIAQRMSRKESCFHRAEIESLFGTPKAEYCHLATLTGLEELEAG
jgi:hypothetical protein